MFPAEPSRIGYVVKRYPRYSETFIVNEILAHEAAGWDVEIFSLRPSNDTHFQDAISRVRAPVHYLTIDSQKAEAFWKSASATAAEFPGFWTALEHAAGEDAGEVYQAMRLARLARERGIEHLHAHFATSAAGVARLAARFAGLPWSFTAHAKDIYHESVCPDDLQRKLRDATGVITVSDFNRNHLLEVHGEAAAHVVRIYNGLHLETFPYSIPRCRPPQIVAVGRLIEKKGFGDLIEACRILAERGEDFTCWIVGTGELDCELREQIAALRLEQQVELLGARPQRDVIGLVREAAVFAAPCVVGRDGNRDGMPTVLLEAMALGTPCVATDVTGIPELVHHRHNGLIVPQRDPATLADALAELLRDERRRVELAEQARRFIEQEFDIHKNAARLREFFCDAVASRHAVAADEGEISAPSERLPATLDEVPV